MTAYHLEDTLLKLDDISLSFGKKLVLRDINLEVKNIVSSETTKGQVITLLGRSGVGKTQLMRIIAGLLKPSTGQVLVGLDQHPVEPGQVGMVLQNYPLFAHRTLLSNLQLICSDKAKINSYLEDFDLIEHRDKYPSQMSGGQRQRTAVVQQLLCSDHFILLDEPFSGLDPVATEKLCKNITKVVNSDDANTAILSSHVLEPSLAISDMVIMLGNDYTTDLPSHGMLSLEPVKLDNGATIKYQYDLAANGLAWNPEIRKDPKFTELLEQIRTIFQTL